jgi:hypothetical protein
MTDICQECLGRRGFYSDTGPAPRWEVCDYCSGAGSFEELVPNMSRIEAAKHVELMTEKAA